MAWRRSTWPSCLASSHSPLAPWLASAPCSPGSLGYLVMVSRFHNQEYDQGDNDEGQDVVGKVAHAEWADHVLIDVCAGGKGIGDDGEDEIGDQRFHDVSKVQAQDEGHGEAQDLVLGKERLELLCHPFRGRGRRGLRQERGDLAELRKDLFVRVHRERMTAAAGLLRLLRRPKASS